MELKSRISAMFIIAKCPDLNLKGFFSPYFFLFSFYSLTELEPQLPTSGLVFFSFFLSFLQYVSFFFSHFSVSLHIMLPYYCIYYRITAVSHTRKNFRAEGFYFLSDIL